MQKLISLNILFLFSKVQSFLYIICAHTMERASSTSKHCELWNEAVGWYFVGGIFQNTFWHRSKNLYFREYRIGKTITVSSERSNTLRWIRTWLPTYNYFCERFINIYSSTLHFRSRLLLRSVPILHHANTPASFTLTISSSFPIRARILRYSPFEIINSYHSHNHVLFEWKSIWYDANFGRVSRCNRCWKIVARVFFWSDSSFA